MKLIYWGSCFYALIKFGTFLSAKNVSICRISLRLLSDKDKESCGNSKECDKKVWGNYTSVRRLPVNKGAVYAFLIIINAYILMYTFIYKKSGAEFIFIQTKGSTNTPVYNKYVHTPDPTSHVWNWFIEVLVFMH